MEEGKYEGAYEALMVWFRRGENTDADYARYFLCNAHIAYERGNVDSADTNLRLYADLLPGKSVERADARLCRNRHAGS